MEFYIQKYVCEEDREMVRQAASREEIEKGLSEGKQYHVNFRTQKKGQLEYYQMKIVRAGVRSGRGSIVLGIRSVDKEIRNEMEQRSNLKDALMQANRASKAKERIPLQYVPRYPDADECDRRIHFAGDEAY